ncbi:hypothetical protein FBEOM_1387 [Fusarium beomiforme]|uniref:Uncharacterized protein n=1 Tax=Fusarium beomiforme TaxID=44412 RepID=A0A9P5ATE5_9HYPO|nr:hypothetical protein FBEOM_1387 [Fusarium beomiforme]
MAKRKSKQTLQKNRRNVPGNIPVHTPSGTNAERNTNTEWTQPSNHTDETPIEVRPIWENERRTYGPRESRKRLEYEGYHPLVTNMTKAEAMASYEEKLCKSVEKPTYHQYYCGKKEQGFQGRYISEMNLLIDAPKSPLVSNYETPVLIKEVFDGTHPHGLQIAQQLASLGIKQLEKFALARPQEWTTLSKGMAIWDFTTNNFHGEPSGHVFLCIFPKISQEAFDESPAHAGPRKDETTARENVIQQIKNIFHTCKPTEAPGWHLKEKIKIRREGPSAEVLRTLTSGTKPPMVVINMARSITNISKLRYLMKKHVDQPKTLDYHISEQIALKNMFSLLTNIFNRRNNIRVLHFQKTPLLDRRLVACILRACPFITTLGIYQCPLFHLGDVICLLDLIHEVNLDRGKRNLPLVEALDFYPVYHAGVPYYVVPDEVLPEAYMKMGMEPKGREYLGYGITWAPVPNEILQRGIFALLLKAVLKARKMGIRLLMDRDAALMKYLSDLPMLPGLIFEFLDGLYRYLDLKEVKSKDKTAVKRAMYDMIKAVRTGLEEPVYKSTSDPSDFVLQKVHSFFCQSCGYKMLDIFFSDWQTHLPEHRRTCTGCDLQACLDKQSDHLKQQKQDLMGHFLEKDWDPKGFNLDAPVHGDGRLLLSLHTRKTTRDPPPPMVVTPDGDFYQPPYEMQLVREDKQSNDCLQGLPSLQALLLQQRARLKNDAKNYALNMDACRALAIIMNHVDPDLAAHKNNHGVNGHFSEGQGYRPICRGFRNKRASHTFYSASLEAEELRKEAQILEGERPIQDAREPLSDQVVRPRINHDGIISSRLLATSEVIDSHQCTGRFSDPDKLVALCQSLSDAHLSSTWKRFDAADSWYEGRDSSRTDTPQVVRRKAGKRHNGYLYIICKANPRHKQRQG